MLIGNSTWIFRNQPSIIATGVVGGPFEAQGNIAADFDYLYDDLRAAQPSFEQAQQVMMETAVDSALKKAALQKDDISFFISGDLINQITPTTFTAEKLNIPYFGLFSACATSTESLALAALMIDQQAAHYVLSGTSSHNAAAERQFRYPTEYGGQIPPTAQWTVTGAGCAIVGPSTSGSNPVITAATIGKVVNMGTTDPYHMGGAMAPAAVDTIIQHFQDRQIAPDYYDVIVTGDLGKVGHDVAFQLLNENGITLTKKQFIDCGMMIYAEDQSVQAGGSGSACSAVVTYGHFVEKLRRGILKRILFVATGALHSPLTVQQKQAIPGIAHAVALEARIDPS